jgi:hypothetical protein
MFGKKKEEPEQELGFDITEFDEKEQDEIERVKTMLEAAEIIKSVARQSRVMPGGSLVTPNIIFATNRRVIIRDPNTLGLRAGVDSIPYSQINKVHLKKGALTSELKLDIGQYESDDNREVIPAIPKKKAAEIAGIINQYIRGAQNYAENIPTPPKTDDDPMKILKIRFAKGEITKEEYNEMKSALE